MIQTLCQIELNGAASVLLEAFLDSVLILPVLFLAHVLMALIDKYAGKKTRNGLKGPLSPLIGAAAGCLPECGFSVAATRLYAQKYIPLGALIAVYISTSDEAMLILLSSADSAKKLWPLLLIKIIYALLAGYIVNLIAHLIAKKKKRKTQTRFGSVLITCTAADDINLFSYKKGTHEVPPPSFKQDLRQDGSFAADAQNRRAPQSVNTQEDNQKSAHKNDNDGADTHNNIDTHRESCSCGCSGHGSGKKEGAWHAFVLHPFIHALKIFVYVLAVNIVLGVIIFFVTPERFESFVAGLSVWQPALAALVGLIPNCASGVILAEMYAKGLLTLGAAVAGLSAAAGLGYAVLIKEHKNKAAVVLIILGMFVCSTLVGMLVDVII